MQVLFRKRYLPAFLIANGASDEEVARTCNMSLEEVHSLKMDIQRLRSCSCEKCPFLEPCCISVREGGYCICERRDVEV